MKIKKSEVEENRNLWAKIAKKNNWYKEPFYVQIWIDKKGNITDSVSTRILDKDYFIFEETDEPIKVKIC